MTTTRARDSSSSTNTSPEDFISKVSYVLYKHVYSVIKIDNLVFSSGDGTYPADSNKDERERIKRLKISCYGEFGRKLKTMGVFSSKMKKESIYKALHFAIQVSDQYNLGIKAVIKPSRIPRGVVEVSVLRAILNGLQKMKLSDARMPAFDDSI
jgi:hypothetical protein